MSEFNSVQAIADRQAITDVIYRYCRAMDRIDHVLKNTRSCNANKF